MTIFEKINEALKEAMKTKNEQRLSAIRMIKSKLLLENARGEIPDSKAQDIITKYAKNLKETIQICRDNNKPEAAVEAEQELLVVKEFLPEELTLEQITAIVQKVIAELKATSLADMGKVMKGVMPLVKGADGSLIKEIVNKNLDKK